MNQFLKTMYRYGRFARTHARLAEQQSRAADVVSRAVAYTTAYRDASSASAAEAEPATNPIWEYFQSHREGRGIWKWEHYFEIYHRHLARFVGRAVNVVEVGVFSGGSLEMWRAYLGDGCQVHGVDIDEACRAYADAHVSIAIGDQADRAFWRQFKRAVPEVDILIDDGGHEPEQQIVTLEEMLPHLRPGGVYLCEDVHNTGNRFTDYATALVRELNRMGYVNELGIEDGTSPFQAAVHAIHFYPFVVVIEKHVNQPNCLYSTRRGTEWQPQRNQESER